MKLTPWVLDKESQWKTVTLSFYEQMSGTIISCRKSQNNNNSFNLTQFERKRTNKDKNVNIMTGQKIDIYTGNLPCTVPNFAMNSGFSGSRMSETTKVPSSPGYGSIQPFLSLNFFISIRNASRFLAENKSTTLKCISLFCESGCTGVAISPRETASLKVDWVGGIMARKWLCSEGGVNFMTFLRGSEILIDWLIGV